MNESNWLTELKSDGVQLGIAELLRYQQYSKLLDLTPKHTPQARLAGTYLTKHKGRGMEFDEARHYQPGDDIRAIDWRVTARTGKTHTKVYREERERPVFVLCDLSPSMQFGTRLLLKSVQAAHLTALISWSAAQRGDKIGALVFNQHKHRECKPLSRKKTVLSICHELQTLNQDAQTHIATINHQALEDACARLRRVARPGSLVYVISDFTHFSEQAEQHLTHISRHCEVRAYGIYDPMEQALPRVSQLQSVSVTDGQEKQSWLLGDNDLAAQYEAQYQAHYQTLHERLGRSRVAFYALSSGQPLTEQLLSARGKRR